MLTLWNTRQEIDRITAWGAFQKDRKEPDKDFDEYDLLHLPFTESRKSAYELSHRVMCHKLSNNTPSEYMFLYEQLPIIELYKYAAIGLAIHHVNK